MGPPAVPVGDPAELLAYEQRPSSDYFDFFSAAGWKHVLSASDVHIFKAAPGTRPVHTSAESWHEELLRNRNQFARYSLITLMILVAVILGVAYVDWNSWFEMFLVVTAIIPVVYTVMPLSGYWMRARRAATSRPRM